MVFLTLGQFTFQNYEIPGEINFGGEQALSVKKLVGGERVIDAMGRDDDDISWSGLFQGTTANFRASFLDGLRIKGQPLPLTWSTYNLVVLIKSFKAKFIRTYWIEYEIVCTPIQNLNAPFPVLLPNAYDSAILNLLTEANDIATILANPSISSSLALVGLAINAIPSLQNATSSALSSVTVPLTGTIGVVGQQINALSSVTFI